MRIWEYENIRNGGVVDKGKKKDRVRKFISEAGEIKWERCFIFSFNFMTSKI